MGMSELTDQQKRFAKLLEDEALRRDVFNEEFFKALDQRHDKYTERIQKVMIVYATITLLLGLTVLSIHMPVSFLGMSATDAHGLRELLLLAGSTVYLFAIIPRLEDDQVCDLLNVRAVFLAGGNKEALKALRLRYGMAEPRALEFDFTAKHRKWDWITFMSATWGFVVWSSISFLLWIFVQVAAMIDIVRDPTVSL